MKHLSLFVAVLLGLLVFMGFSEMLPAQTTKEKTVEEKIIDILKDEKIIGAEKYNALKKQLENEKITDTNKTRLTFKKGFGLETSDKAFTLKLSGRFHNDLRIYQSDHPKNSEFLVRRARICASGTIYKYYSFKVEPEFGMGGGALNDGYLNIKYIPEIQCKIGQFKVPFSVDELTSDNYIDFIERPLPADNLVPSRDYGIMFHGDLASGIVHYGIGIFNGTRKNKGDCNDEKDIAARLVLSPFQKCENLCLQGLHLGGAMTSGNEDMSIQSDQDYWWSKGKFQTAGDTKFFEFDSAVSHRGRRNRYGAELVWIRGPFSLKGEWMRIDLNDLENGSQRGNFHIKGGYVSCSYFITGEQQPFTKGVYKGITPKHKLSPKEGNWGAIQLIARYEMLDLDNHFLTDGYANAAQYTDQVDGFTLGVNWWLNANVRVMVNYNHVDFDNYVAAAGGTSEDIGLFRFQLIY